MSSSAVGRKSKQQGKPKTNARSLKRKRDVDDHERLEKSVADLVSARMGFLDEPKLY